MATYKTQPGQNWYDVCLMAYGDLDLLPKLFSDNGIDGIDTYPVPNTLISYDATLSVNTGANIATTNNGLDYCTRATTLGNGYYQIQTVQ